MTATCIRLRDETFELLKKAKQESRMSMASIIDNIVRRELLSKYGDINRKIDRMIKR